MRCRTSSSKLISTILDSPMHRYGQKYQILPLIGTGGFGYVYAGEKRIDGLPVALKYIKSDRILNWSDLNGRRVPLEVKMMDHVSECPGVVRLVDHFFQDEYYVIVTLRLPSYHDLHDFIGERKRLGEDMARTIFRQIINAILACYDKGVLHGDIKDENILVNVSTLQVLLIDFGSSTYVDHKLVNKFGGTRVYAPPEVITNCHYDLEKVDVWSLGILICNMINGDIPFETDEDICQTNIKFVVTVSKECRNLIMQCLKQDVSCRLSLVEIAEDPWLSLHS